MKKIIKENYRVIIIPTIHGWLLKAEDKTDEEVCVEHLLKDVKRHIDCEQAHVEFDSKEICEFCLEEWDEYDRDFPDDNIKKGLPGCCGKAQDEWREQNEAD